MFRGFLFLVFSIIVLNSGAAQANCTLELTMDGAIGPASLDFLERGMRHADEKKCDSVLVLINTPGGSLQTTRLIVEQILASRLPILCLISPSGGHAGSAGAIIMQACHVNGALEATNIGAATPIAGSGQEIAKDLRKKLINDTTSWIDGLTKLRGRSQKFGRDIVTEAKAVSAKEAKEIGAVDILAQSKQQFLQQAAGRIVKMSQNQETSVVVSELFSFQKDVRHKVVSFLTDPQTAYLMLMGSLGLLYFEITHPGMMVPGIVGGMGLIISMVSLHKLNVTWGGMLLMLLGVALMIAEAFVPSFGALGLGGIAAFFTGSLFLFDATASGYSVPMDVVLPTTIGLGILMMLVAYMAFKTRNVKKRGEFGELEGHSGIVVKISGGGIAGLMEIHGETWKFKCNEKIELGDEVVVTDHKGLTLKVRKGSETEKEI